MADDKLTQQARPVTRTEESDCLQEVGAYHVTVAEDDRAVEASRTSQAGREAKTLVEPAAEVGVRSQTNGGEWKIITDSQSKIVVEDDLMEPVELQSSMNTGATGEY